MKIDPNLMKSCTKDFKKFGTLTYALIMRRHGINLDMAKTVIEVIKKRYPKLWMDREINREKKWIEGMKP